eukprot:5753074-Pleurochrysis_carterae.AAC.3
MRQEQSKGGTSVGPEQINENVLHAQHHREGAEDHVQEQRNKGPSAEGQSCARRRIASDAVGCVAAAHGTAGTLRIVAMRRRWRRQQRVGVASVGVHVSTGKPMSGLLGVSPKGGVAGVEHWDAFLAARLAFASLRASIVDA